MEDAGFFPLTHSGVGGHHHSDLHLRLWCQHLEPGCSSETSVIRRDSALLDALAKPRGLMVTACESGFSNCFLVGRFPFYTPKSLMV